ncbi:zinc finger protein 701-like [Patiria miniata]|uniref:C2H2-type domain-containing protein n=1 Tax=Patiria miniata TaxID=46514 RepID=A0A913ZZI1_PATMI|nr:zinc finger protein 701-like [Patiria miniata]
MIVDVLPEPSAAVKQQGLQDGREQNETAVKGRRYPCGTCGKVFRQLTNLIRHRKLHEIGPNVNKKAVTCPVCSKVFSRPNNLKRHRKNHTADQLPSTTRQISHQGNGESPRAEAGSNCTPPQSSIVKMSICPACGGVFQRVNQMLCHLQNDHGGVSASYYTVRAKP